MMRFRKKPVHSTLWRGLQRLVFCRTDMPMLGFKRPMVRPALPDRHGMGFKPDMVGQIRKIVVSGTGAKKSSGLT